ncbi:MAG: hypothetical protein CMP19_05070 [Rickettsiales bacterium]|nr:hypothetical protein [Rickettsiales bacterium]|tara:strand:+ start:1251 stop:1433 length:183 start_codon:yes stop_codon:yes gene_type:complete
MKTLNSMSKVFFLAMCVYIAFEAISILGGGEKNDMTFYFLALCFVITKTGCEIARELKRD